MASYPGYTIARYKDAMVFTPRHARPHGRADASRWVFPRVSVYAAGI